MSRPAPAFTLIDPLSQFFLLARFLCFMAVFYLALHKTVARFSRKPGSKLLWFFAVVTTPLTRPIRRWLDAGAGEDRVVTAALWFYGILWLLIVGIERFWLAPAR